MSLLERAKARDAHAWDNLVSLYGPLVYRWARRAGLQPHDAQDVVQNVFLSVDADLEKFRRNRPGDTFRGWLWTITRHKILDQFRQREREAQAAGGSTALHRFEQLADLEPDETEMTADRCRLRQRAMRLLRGQFEKHVWEAFFRTVVHSDRPTDVARDLGVSVATVYRAKVRVLMRLRSELDDL